jgi:hypothetical protein
MEKVMSNSTPSPTGFWASGGWCFTSALDREEKAMLAPLREALASSCDPERRMVLKRQIADIRADFKARRKAARYSLFSKG